KNGAASAIGLLIAAAVLYLAREVLIPFVLAGLAARSYKGINDSDCRTAAAALLYPAIKGGSHGAVEQHRQGPDDIARRHASLADHVWQWHGRRRGRRGAEPP